MNRRKFLAIALVGLALGVGAPAALVVAQSFDIKHSMTLTFDRPVALPGVVLRSGSYIFEFPDPVAAHNVVRVLSRDRRRVYLTAFTQPITRPENLPPNQHVSFGEASATVPQPITVWWPWDLATGRRFVYAR